MQDNKFSPAVIRNRNNRIKLRKILQRLKHNKPCLDCRIVYPYWIMQYDHVRGKKKFDVSQWSTHTRNIKVVLEEIAKCDLVCANCHHNRTHERRIGKQNIMN